MSFQRYLGIINDLKIVTGKQKAKLDRLINTWQDTSEKGLNKLGGTLQQDLNLLKQSCANPINFLKSHIAERRKLLRR